MYVYFIIAVDGREWQWRSELDISTGDCKTDASSSKTKVVDVLIFLELFHFVNEIISWNWINTRTLSEWQSLNVQNKFTFTFLLNSGKFRAVSCFFFWCCCCSFSMFIFIFSEKLSYQFRHSTRWATHFQSFPHDLFRISPSSAISIIE